MFDHDMKNEKVMNVEAKQNIIQIGVLQHVGDNRDTWLHVQPPSTSVAKQL